MGLKVDWALASSPFRMSSSTPYNTPKGESYKIQLKKFTRTSFKETVLFTKSYLALQSGNVLGDHNLMRMIKNILHCFCLSIRFSNPHERA